MNVVDHKTMFFCWRRSRGQAPYTFLGEGSGRRLPGGRRPSLFATSLVAPVTTLRGEQGRPSFFEMLNLFRCILQHTCWKIQVRLCNKGSSTLQHSRALKRFRKRKHIQTMYFKNTQYSDITIVPDHLFDKRCLVSGFSIAKITSNMHRGNILKKACTKLLPIVTYSKSVFVV